MKPMSMETDAPMEAEETMGIDSIIATVDGYISDPTTATRQTLSMLKADLLDLKDYLDSETNQMPMNEETSTGNAGKSPLVAAISETTRTKGGK